MLQRIGITGILVAVTLCVLPPLTIVGGEPPAPVRPPVGISSLPPGRRAALPQPGDLVHFDDSPIRPDLIVELDELDTTQGAFPVYYGALPVSPASGRYTHGGQNVPAMPPPATGPVYPVPGGVELGSGTSLASRVEGTADIAVPVPDGAVPVGSAVITPATGDAGFLDYQAYLDRARERDNQREAVIPAAPVVPTQPAQPVVAVRPSEQPEVAARPPVTDIPGAPGFVPPPPPPELLQAAGGTDQPTELAGPAPGGPAMEPIPLPPPPLPELPNHRAPRPDLNKLHEDFNRLRAFCETDNLGSAAEVFAHMPEFGEDEEMNRIRADAANLLILGLSRTGDLPSARRVYDSLPVQIAGFEAMLAKARAIINLTTYYVRAEQYNEAYAVLMGIGTIQNRSALNNELFRLMARMIPYLDNAEETDKAQSVFNLLLREVKSPGTAALFADNIHGVIRYYLHYVDRSESPQRRRIRLDVLEHIYDSLQNLSGNPDIAELRKSLGMDLSERFSTNPERAAHFRGEN